MLMRNPLLADHLEFTPFHLFTTAEKTMCIYSEWLSGDAAYGAGSLNMIRSTDGAGSLNMVRSTDQSLVGVSQS